jgi:GMP synthase-like glutamine amidotransferase
MVTIALCNLNLQASERGGCERIAEAIRLLAPRAQVTLYHFAELRRDPGLIARATALVLGPQGTPFGDYDRAFLPWLRALMEVFPGPVLGVCGGMQVLALAWGGTLETAYGEAVGESYEGLRKVRGPLPVQLELDALPAWLPDAARRRLAVWRDLGGHCFESHVEQVVEAPNAFVTVAHSAVTPIEAMAHRRRPILASQFHPEMGWDQGCEAGKLWLEAWLELVRAVE